MFHCDTLNLRHNVTHCVTMIIVTRYPNFYCAKLRLNKLLQCELTPFHDYSGINAAKDLVKIIYNNYNKFDEKNYNKYKNNL